MTTLITLNLANAEVFHLFKRKTAKDEFFMTEITKKIASLMRQAKALDAHALLALDVIQQQLIDFTQRCYDDIDRFDAMLEKKKHLQNKKIHYQSQFFPEIAFENQISNHLIELFERYDGVISRLKTLRHAGCFENDYDYFVNLRRHQRAINQLLSELLLTPIKNSDPLSVWDIVDRNDVYRDYFVSYGVEIHVKHLYAILTSSLVPRIEEKIRIPLLAKMKQQLQKNASLPETIKESA